MQNGSRTVASLLALAFVSTAGPSFATDGFAHDGWTSVLQVFVDERGFVDYRGLAGDRALFDEYVTAVERTSPRSNPERFPTRNERLAYYLNAYNALVIKGVLERGPEEESVWRGAVSGLDFFVEMKVTVGGEVMSLKKLEDDIVRAEFEDPRVHAALNCASIGCPRLPRVAFLPDKLDEQLDAAIREFIDQERNCVVDDAERTVTLSKIFDWFGNDFTSYELRQGVDKPEVVDYVNRYRTADKPIPRDYEVRFLEYDKRINKQ